MDVTYIKKRKLIKTKYDNCTQWSPKYEDILALHFTDSFKGETRNRTNLISEEGVKLFEQNSENLMKIC